MPWKVYVVIFIFKNIHVWPHPQYFSWLKKLHTSLGHDFIGKIVMYQLKLIKYFHSFIRYEVVFYMTSRSQFLGFRVSARGLEFWAELLLTGANIQRCELGNKTLYTNTHLLKLWMQPVSKQKDQFSNWGNLFPFYMFGLSLLRMLIMKKWCF